jgi:hypothetical protein
MVAMNRLDTETRCRVVSAVVEGNSIRATVRMTRVAKNTIQKLLLELGAAALAYEDRVMRNLPCKRIQVDECWAFCYAKTKNVTVGIAAKKPYAGDGRTWAAIDADTKMIPSWIIGRVTA